MSTPEHTPRESESRKRSAAATSAASEDSKEAVADSSAAAEAAAAGVEAAGPSGASRGSASGAKASASVPRAPASAEPVYKDRVYRSPGGLVGGGLLLGLLGWLGGDAVVSGEGWTPWLALAALLFAVPVVGAFSVRPAVFANDDRLRVRNPLRVIELPWAAVVSLRSGYTNEVVDQEGTKYQLWAVPVSLRARKKAARRQAWETARTAKGDSGGRTSLVERPVRAEADQVMADLRVLCEARAKAPGSQGETSVRWAWEVIAPALAGVVLFVVLWVVG